MKVRTPVQTTIAALMLIVLLLGALFAWQCGAFAYIDDNLNRRYRIEGLAMEPTLCNGKYVAFHKPDPPFERFEIIVFRFHLDTGLGQGDRHFIKRIVGLPNETIEIREGVIWIDGKPLSGDVYAPAAGNYSFESIVIPESRYFVLGDNRRNSFDSHQWASQAPSPDARADTATVPEENIVGELPADAEKC